MPCYSCDNCVMITLIAHSVSILPSFLTYRILNLPEVALSQLKITVFPGFRAAV